MSQLIRQMAGIVVLTQWSHELIASRAATYTTQKNGDGILTFGMSLSDQFAIGVDQDAVRILVPQQWWGWWKDVPWEDVEVAGNTMTLTCRLAGGTTKLRVEIYGNRILLKHAFSQTDSIVLNWYGRKSEGERHEGINLPLLSMYTEGVY